MLQTLSGADFALFISVFLACTVEAVEAVTIVLAAGTSRNWRSASQGVIAALILLTALIFTLGPSIEKLPESILQLAVGGLLLVFGMQWLRKAILRASGFKALHDEEKIFREEVQAAEKAARVSHFVVTDWYAFMLSFKGVLLEGLEVAFIVVTFGVIQKGSNPQAFSIALWAALSSVVLVTSAGFVIHKPLSRVPENSMKFIVGVLLTSFGIFWGADGAGANWPHHDLSLLVIIPSVAALCFLLIEILKARKVKGYRVSPLRSLLISPPKKTAPRIVRISGGFIYFWYDFIVGDDWRVAAAIVLALAATHSLDSNSWWLLPAAVAAVLIFTLLEASAAKPSDTSQ
ncbi:COG4280 Predicted membrane protein [Candidatus Nanopelagicaceae bacterium]